MSGSFSGARVEPPPELTLGTQRSFYADAGFLALACEGGTRPPPPPPPRGAAPWAAPADLAALAREALRRLLAWERQTSWNSQILRILRVVGIVGLEVILTCSVVSLKDKAQKLAISQNLWN